MGPSHSRNSTSQKIWKQKFGHSIAVIGPNNSGVSTISAEVNKRITNHALPFSAVVDSQNLFFERVPRYFGRAAMAAYDIDRRAKSMARLGALIVVIDCSNLLSVMSMKLMTKRSKDEDTPASYESMPEYFLSTMVNDRLDVLVGKPILVLANKRDLPKAATAEKIRNSFFSRHLEGLNIRIQECVAVQNEGVEEGMNWLAEQMELIQKRKKLRSWNRPQLKNTLTIAKLEKYLTQHPQLLQKPTPNTHTADTTVIELPRRSVNDQDMNGSGGEKSVSVLSTVINVLL